MTDTKALRFKIKQLGLKYKFIAEELGISVETLRRKIDNKNAFNADEILGLSKLLKLNLREKNDIFFNSNVD